MRRKKHLTAVSAAMLVCVSAPSLAAPGAAYNVGAPAPSFKSDSASTSSPGYEASSDGEVGHSVGLTVPLGRSGLQPDVQLRYSSRGAIRGGVAAGWSLPIPMISVDTSGGRAQSLSYEMGGKRLVEVSEPGVTGRKTYRLDRDPSFTRYEKVSDGSESGYWQARTLDGKVYTYGGAPSSKDVRTQGAPGDAVYGGQGRWFLSEVRDASGNLIVYNYETVYGDARNATVTNTPVDVVLTSIEYGRNLNDPSSEHHARIELDYKASIERCASSYVPIGARFNYRTGIRRYEGAKKLLALRARVRPAKGAAWMTRRELTLGYDPSAEYCNQLHGAHRVLSSVTERVVAPDGTQIVLPPQTFEYGPLEMDFGGASPGGDIQLSSGKDPHHGGKPGGWPALDGARMDLDGDGTPEYVSGASCAQLPKLPWANGTSPGGSSSDLRYWEGCSLTAQVMHRSINRATYSCGDPTEMFGYRFMDVNGDGLPDLVASMSYQKGRYHPSEDPALTSLYPNAYPACSSMPAPRCVDGQGDPIPCLLNQYIQYVNYTDPARAMTDHSWDGLANGLYTAPLFFNAAAAGSSGSGGSGGSGSGGSPDGGNPDGGSGGSGGTVTACPGSTCAQNGSCQGSQNECCGISFCADTDTPQGDPPDAAASLFHGSKPEAQEHMGRTPGANPRCGHVPDMHCGSYVLWVYLNTGTGSGLARFASTPKIVHSPVPLESDQMTSDQGVGAMANASAWRATADLDGDGLPDAVYQTPDDLIPVSGFSERRFRVWFGDGQGAFRGGNLGGRLWNTPPATYANQRPTIETSYTGVMLPGPGVGIPYLRRTPTSTGNTFRDINGDGLLDYVRGTQVFYNTGTGFETEGTFLTPQGTFSTISQRVRTLLRSSPTDGDDAYSINTVRMMDLDNDGLDDVVQLSPPGYDQFNPLVDPAGATIQGYMNTGDSFRPVMAGGMAKLAPYRTAFAGVTVENANGWVAKTDVLDENGDGLYDVTVPGDMSGCPTGEWSSYDLTQCGYFTRVVRSPSRPLHVLTAINNGVGGRTVFTYASSADAATVERVAGSRLPSPLWVLKSVSVSSGSPNEAAQVTDYRYVDPVSNTDRLGKFAFRGFRSVVSTGPTPATGRRKRTLDTYAFDQDEDGLLVRSAVAEVWSANDGHEDLVSVTDTVYGDLPLFAGPLAENPARVHVYAPTETKTATCRTPKLGMTTSSIAACLADATVAREVATWEPLSPPSGAAQVLPPVAWAATRSRRTSDPGNVALAGDRLETIGFRLRHAASEYRLLTEWSERRDGVGILLSRSESTFEASARALPTQSRVWMDGSTVATSLTTYNTVGLPAYTMRPNQFAAASIGGVGLYATIAYDPFNVYIAARTNELGQTSRSTIDLATGATLSQFALAQGAVVPATQYTIDGLGRVRETRRTVESSPGVYTDKVVYTATFVDTAPRRVTRNARRTEGDWISTVSFLDGLGRVTREESPSASGLGVLRRSFDGAGNLVATWVNDPSGQSGEVLYWTQFDAFHRESRIKNPDSAQVQIVYTGPTKTVYEWPLDGGPLQYRRLDHDAFGRLVTVYEGYPSTTTTQYRYDASDRTTDIVDADGVATKIAYDLAGNRVSVTRAGNQVGYVLDLNGNRTHVYHPTQSGQRDPIRGVSQWVFDALDRVVAYTPADRDLTPEQLARYFDDGTGVARTTVYTYDQLPRRHGAGRLTKVESPFGTTTFDYTVEGHLEQEARTITVKPETVPLSMSSVERHAYDLLGNVTQVTHPDAAGAGATISAYAYDDRGRPLSAAVTLPGGAQKTVASFERNAAGVVTRRNTAVTSAFQAFTYDAAGRPKSMDVQGGWCLGGTCSNGVIAGEVVAYYENGTPKSYTDRAKSRTIDLKYNDRVELVDARTAGGDYVGAFTFTPSGRVGSVDLRSSLAGAEVVNRAVTHSYAPRGANDRADPAAVRALRDIATGAEIASMFYDSSGNLTRRVHAGVTRDFAYDGADQLREVRDPTTGAFEVYWYDQQGRRALTYRSAAGGQPATLKHRFGATDVTLTVGGSTASTADVMLGGRAVARVTDGAETAVEYLFHGALGNLLAVVDEQGKGTARYGYGPFGETLYAEGSHSSSFEQRYEGQTRDAFSRLSYFGRRYYDPLLLSWTQADPVYRVAPDLAWSDPRRMAPFTYVLNNPLAMIDPDGRDSFAAAESWNSRNQKLFTPGHQAIPIAPTGGGQVTVVGTLPVPTSNKKTIAEELGVSGIMKTTDIHAKVQLSLTTDDGQIVQDATKVHVRFYGTLTVLGKSTTTELPNDYRDVTVSFTTRKTDPGVTYVIVTVGDRAQTRTTSAPGLEGEAPGVTFQAGGDSESVTVVGNDRNVLVAKVVNVTPGAWNSRVVKEDAKKRDIEGSVIRAVREWAMEAYMKKPTKPTTKPANIR